MKRRLLVLNHSVLLLCASLYLGTGWSLILFSFPVAAELTPANYWLQFVPQVTAATRFFTPVTIVMLVAALVMCVSEWRTRLRWVPLVALGGMVAATALTMTALLPLNREMAAGITDPVRLGEILERWMSLNRIRVGLWTVQWLALMTYFAVRTWEREVSRDAPTAAGAGAAGDLRRDGAERIGAAAGT